MLNPRLSWTLIRVTVDDGGDPCRGKFSAPSRRSCSTGVVLTVLMVVDVQVLCQTVSVNDTIKKNIQVLESQGHLKTPALLKRQVEESTLDKKTIEERRCVGSHGSGERAGGNEPVIQARRKVSFTMEVTCKKGSEVVTIKA